MVRFERDVPMEAARVAAGQLVVGRVYYLVGYGDAALQHPAMEPVVYVGRNFDGETNGSLYFQDVQSFEQGVTWDTASAEDPATFSSFPEKDGPAVYEFDDALDVLLKCALQRRGAWPDAPR